VVGQMPVSAKSQEVTSVLLMQTRGFNPPITYHPTPITYKPNVNPKPVAMRL